MMSWVVGGEQVRVQNTRESWPRSMEEWLGSGVKPSEVGDQEFFMASIEVSLSSQRVQ